MRLQCSFFLDMHPFHFETVSFEDPDFSKIPIIGFLIQSNGIEIGSGWVDSFTISGPGLAVSPQAKLATTWGQFKTSR